jgi:hypothetical protein
MEHDRSTLKFSYLAVQRTEPAASDPKQFRVIGGPMRDAGLLRRYVCGPDGRRVVEVPELQAPPALGSAWRGDILTLNGVAGETNRQGRREPVLQLSDLPPPRPRPPEGRGSFEREGPRPGFESGAPPRNGPRSAPRTGGGPRPSRPKR